MHSVPRVLVVEDDDAIRALLLTALTREPLAVDAAEDGDVALALTAQRTYEVIILDLMLPRVHGLEFLEAFRKTATNEPVVLVVSAFDDLAFDRIPAEWVHAIVRKPFDLLYLVTIVREVALAAQGIRQQEVLAEEGAAVVPAARQVSIC
ncbi:MAG TPA: response regulator [Thermoanaerobaculia bacterium]|nr:response regulator [Thermoanaerobaculia bacterium]